MAIDKFTKEEFEKALPTTKKNGNRLWKCIGLVKGEYTYILPIQKKSNTVKLRLVIRSSIGPDGIAAETGEDSIRVYFEYLSIGNNPKNRKWVAFGKGAKNHWVTRVYGWDIRLTEHLRKLYRIGLKVDHVICPLCGDQLPIKVVKRKDSERKGDAFQSCSELLRHPKTEPTYFKWLSDKEQS